MNFLSRIAFPAAVIAMTAAAASTPSREAPGHKSYVVEVSDTVVYPADRYKIGRVGTVSDEKLPDSLYRKARINVFISDGEIIDTVATPDSLLTPEELAKKRADSINKAQLAYNDSIKEAREEAKAIRDSIFESKPRILETFALPDSMQYKRLIAWKLDQDFQNVKPFIPDTSFNAHYYDYTFLKEDVNATWLGVAGSPVQTYDYFKRDVRDEGVEFYRAQESWAYSPATFLNYNSKTPYTELGYSGTLIAGKQKESNNVHLMTTQNILPELNFTLLFDKWGGEGVLQNEKTDNKVWGIGFNYLGKNYMGHLGYLGNKVSRNENGGVEDVSEIRDTTLECREVDVRLSNASSKIMKHSVYLDNQFRIPLVFSKKKKAQADTSAVEALADSVRLTVPEKDASSKKEEDKPQPMQKDVTSAFIGQTTEFTMYSRNYNDEISSGQTAARQMYSDAEGNFVANYNPTTSADTLGASKLDNRVFLRLQPWSSQGIVSKLDVGVGDRLMMYSYGAPKDSITKRTENSFFIYAGAQGQYRQYLNWDAKMHYNLIGDRMGDFDVNANANFNFFPFRKARTSPLNLGVSFTQSLKQPSFYQEHFYSNHYSWENQFKKASTTKVEGHLDIPRWRTHLGVSYALLANNVYYDTLGIARQNEKAMSVITGSLRQDFVLWRMLHLENSLLAQWSSDQGVLPLPTLALNLRWYVEFIVKRDKLRQPIMTMQIGLNGFYNTPWYAPAWNPVTGTFQNQNQRKYTNGPFFDVFVNVQWKRACIFIKFENAGMGWPRQKGKDYFSADRYIVTERGVKFGVFWPFYIQPHHNHPVSFDSQTK